MKSASAKQYFAMPEIRDTDIKISTQPTDYEEIGRYITAMSQTMASNSAAISSTQTEPEIIKEAVETKDMRKIGVLLELYRQGRKNKTNNGAERFCRHSQKAIGDIYATGKIMTAIKNLEEDPAMASAAIESYP